MSLEHRPAQKDYQLKGITPPLILSPEQQTLVLSVSNYIGFYARHFTRRLGHINFNVEAEDLIQEGYMGAISAVQRFLPQLGVTFESFAKKRIKGQMIDAIRRRDTLPASTVRYISQIRRIEAQALTQGATLPTEDEISQMTGLSSVEIKNYRDLSNIRFEPLNDSKIKTEEPYEGTFDDSDEDRDEPKDPNSAVEKSELLMAIRSLPVSERNVIVMLYVYGYSPAEVAERFNMTTAQVSRTRRSAIDLLKYNLESVPKLQSEPVVSVVDELVERKTTRKKDSSKTISGEAFLHLTGTAPQRSSSDRTKATRNVPEKAPLVIPDGYIKLNDLLANIGTTYRTYNQKGLGRGLDLLAIGHGGTIYVSSSDQDAIRQRLIESGWKLHKRESKGFTPEGLRSLNHLISLIPGLNASELTDYLNLVRSDGFAESELSQAINHSLSQMLSSIEVEVVQLRTGLLTGQPMTQEQVATHVGKHATRVHQIEAAVIKKLTSS